MLYGYLEELTTVIGAADSEEELIDFCNQELQYCESAAEADFMEYVTSQTLFVMKIIPFLVQHVSSEQQAKFIEQYNITILPAIKVQDKNAELVTRKKYLAEASNTDRLEVVLGLDKEDKWDFRTDKQKEVDAKAKREAEGLTLEEYNDKQIAERTQNPQKSGEKTIDIVDENGNVVNKLNITITGAELDTDPVLYEGGVLFYRIDIEDTWYNVENLVKDFDIVNVTDNDYDCSIVVRTSVDMFAIMTVLKDNNIVCGSQIITPTGKQFKRRSFDETTEIGPRPWNDRAAELLTMTPDELAENKKSYSGIEFIICGGDTDTGSKVFITPKDYFEKNDTMWPNSLEIEHLLPSITEISPGVYKSYADWNHLSLSLAQNDFKESLSLRIHINNL